MGSQPVHAHENAKLDAEYNTNVCSYLRSKYPAGSSTTTIAPLSSMPGDCLPSTSFDSADAVSEAARKNIQEHPIADRTVPLFRENSRQGPDWEHLIHSVRDKADQSNGTSLVGDETDEPVGTNSNVSSILRNRSPEHKIDPIRRMNSTASTSSALDQIEVLQRSNSDRQQSGMMEMLSFDSVDHQLTEHTAAVLQVGGGTEATSGTARATNVDDMVKVASLFIQDGHLDESSDSLKSDHDGQDKGRINRILNEIEILHCEDCDVLDRSSRRGERPIRECSICMDEFEVGDTVSWAPHALCTHVFHHQCIKNWLLRHAECPCCRRYGKLFWMPTAQGLSPIVLIPCSASY
jgi:Ring finger domain